MYRLVYDEGGTLREFVEVIPSSAGGQLFINPFALDRSAADVMYYPAGSNLWRNNDLENSPSSGWAELTEAQVPGENITALGVSSDNDAHVLLLRHERGHPQAAGPRRHDGPHHHADGRDGDELPHRRVRGT